jgi:hypothetical protein
MKIWKLLVPCLLVPGLCALVFLPVSRARAGAGAAPGVDATTATPTTAPVPAIVQRGFTAWVKNRDASWAFDQWKLGGLLERDNKPSVLARYFARNDANIGSFKNYELVNTKPISQNSVVLYLCLNFDRAAVYGRFVVYRTDKDWVVQDMDFSPKPETMMPWLAFEGNAYDQ